MWLPENVFFSFLLCFSREFLIWPYFHLSHHLEDVDPSPPRRKCCPLLTVSFKLRKWVLQIRMTPNGRTSLKILALPRLVSSPHQSDLKGPMSQLQGPLWVWCVLKTAICQLGHESCIPHICHRHHRRCLCKFFLSGVKFSWLNMKMVHVFYKCCVIYRKCARQCMIFMV